MSMEVRILPFNQLPIHDLYQSLKLRQDVFMLEQACLFSDMDNLDLKAWHVVGKFEKQVVAYTRIFGPGEYYPGFTSIGRVVASPAHRKCGYGRKIMEVSIQYCLNQWPDIPVKIGAQQYLEAFYQSLGFESTGPTYIEDGIPHLYMTLDQKKSPLS